MEEPISNSVGGSSGRGYGAQSHRASRFSRRHAHHEAFYERSISPLIALQVSLLCLGLQTVPECLRTILTGGGSFFSANSIPLSE
jgi:hypothetical protein